MAATMRVGDYIKDAIAIYKANFIPLLLGAFLGAVPGVQTNLLAQVLRYRANGQAITVGELFNFDNVIDKFLSTLFGSLLLLPTMSMPLLAEHPGLSFADSWKVGWTFGTKEVGGMLLLGLATMGAAFSGLLLCCVGAWLTIPLMLPIFALAYEDHRDAILKAATEAGVELPEASRYDP
jgi:hypothetical protein